MEFKLISIIFSYMNRCTKKISDLMHESTWFKYATIALIVKTIDQGICIVSIIIFFQTLVDNINNPSAELNLRDN